METPARWAKQLILKGKRYGLLEVPDEIFMDLHEGPGTQYLAATCYGQAVRDCQVVGSDYFLLKVRPDMRGLLLSQLRKVYKAFRVYRFEGIEEGRILLTDELLLRFAPGATTGDRRESLKRYFPGAEEEDELEDGVYRLAGTFSEDPILISNALQENPMIAEVSPIIVAVPRLLDVGADEAMEASEPLVSETSL